MTITEKHAQRLIRERKGVIVNIVREGEKFYAALERADKNRTDHFLITQARYNKLQKKWREKSETISTQKILQPKRILL